MNLFSPAQIAENYVSIGKSKVNTAIPKMFLLAVTAGVFIALGGVGATTAAVGVQPAAIGKLLGACIFPGGLTMVLLAGSELFTGNCLLTVPLFSGEVTLPGVLRNWIVVYLGNFAGGLLVAAGAVYSHQLRLFGNGMAVSVISTAAGKRTMSFSGALIRGVFCNFLVCIAVWISFTAKDAAGKVAAHNIDEYLGYHHKLDCVENPYTHEEAMQGAGRCLRCDYFGCRKPSVLELSSGTVHSLPALCEHLRQGDRTSSHHSGQNRYVQYH